MTTYAIGDIQGCHREFNRLLDSINFDSASDSLWLAGDLVNRGPDSLGLMQTIIQLGDVVHAVLGNHDLHFLAHARELGPKLRKGDTFVDILESSDRERITTWIRNQPFIKYDTVRNTALVHAGIYPSWGLQKALDLSSEVCRLITDESLIDDYLHGLYGDTPSVWSEQLEGAERSRFITNAFTRMRFLEQTKKLNLQEKGSLLTSEAKLQPWYTVEDRRTKNTLILFGHWSSLELSEDTCQSFNIRPLDTGAVWGGKLTAFDIDSHSTFSVSSNYKAESSFVS